MMTTRILPHAEWSKLAATDLPAILPYVDADDLQVVVVEHEGRVVGCWGLMPMWHLEGCWIDPAYRGKSSVARRLLAATWVEVRQRASKWVMTAAVDDRVRGLLTKHLGALPVPGDQYLIPLHGAKRCPSLR